MKERIKQAVWLLVVLGLTAFIFSRSLQNGTESSQESAWFQELLVTVFGPGAAESVFYRFIRKLAHFSEFAALGLAWRGYVGSWRRPRWLWLAAGPLTAIADECIQRFSPGRGPSVRDVLLDCAGFACGVGLMTLALFLWRCRCHRKAVKNEEKGVEIG